MALTNGVHSHGEYKESKPPEDDSSASPYTTRPITVKIGINGTPFQILEGFVLRYPGLQARIKQNKAGATIELPEVAEDVGHTLSHFIYTGHYNGVGLGGGLENVLATAEFKQSVLAYCAARLCGIDALEQITMEKMDNFSQQLSVFELHDIVVGVAPKLPENEVWFPEHLYRWIKRTLEDNDEIMSSEHFLTLVGDCKLFNKALVRSITELCTESRATVQMLSKDKPVMHDTSPVVLEDSTHAKDNNITAYTEATEELATNVTPLITSPRVTELSEGIPSIAQDELVDSPNDGATTELPQIVHADTAVKRADSVHSKADNNDVVEPQSEGTAVDGQNGDDSQSNVAAKPGLEDSDVEAAREKTSKKSKKKKSKKTAPAPAVA